jgi:hypothetical protein
MGKLGAYSEEELEELYTAPLTDDQITRRSLLQESYDELDRRMAQRFSQTPQLTFNGRNSFKITLDRTDALEGAGEFARHFDSEYSSVIEAIKSAYDLHRALQYLTRLPIEALRRIASGDETAIHDLLKKIRGATESDAKQLEKPQRKETESSSNRPEAKVDAATMQEIIRAIKSPIENLLYLFLLQHAMDVHSSGEPHSRDRVASIAA